MDGFSTFVATEPYSRSNANLGGGGGSPAGGSASTRAAATGGRGQQAGRGRQSGPPGRVQLTGKSVEEKLALICGDFNAKGCARPQCMYMHKCSYVDRANGRVCFANHSKANH